MKISRGKIKTLCLALLTAVVFVFAQRVATAQQLKPTEIIYSRLQTNLQAAPTGANSPTIWAVGQDGSNDRKICDGMQPRISDDGRYLLYKKFPGSPNNLYGNPWAGEGQLWVRDLANNSETMVFSWYYSSNVLSYYFSPASNQGQYQIILSYGTLIYKMNLDGTGRVVLPGQYERDNFPVARRGDSRIVSHAQDNTGLVTLTLDTATRTLIPNTLVNDYNPSWSNDNQFVGFASTFFSNANPFNTSAPYPYVFSKLSKIKPDGTSRTALLDLNSNTNGIAFGTIWTDDNSKIIVAAKINGATGLYSINTDGSGNYTRIPISDGNAPDWVGGIVQARNEQSLFSSGGLLGNPPNGFSMLYSIGEPVVGDFSSGSYSLSGGFLTGLSNAEARAYEADVQSRPNGDGYIDSDDIQQIRRFAVGLDLPYQSNEFQRADCAPRSTLGDGFVDADDVAQARRYSVGLDYTDPLASGGPQEPLAAITPPTAEEVLSLVQSATFENASPASGRAIRVVNQVVSSGGTVTVPINVDTMGDETGYTFSVAFDRTKMTAASVVIGNLGGNIISNINNTNGTIGFSVSNFSGPDGTISAATNQTLVKINFTTVSSLAGAVSNIIFTDSPARRKVSGVDPNNPLPQPTYTNGTTTIAAATGANVGYVGWWAGDGDARDSSGISNNASLAASPNTPGFIIGKVGQAYNFTAEGQYVSIPDSPAVRPQSFTIEGWTKLTNPQSPYPTVFGKGLGTGYYDSYAVWYDGNLNAAVCDLSAGCAQITAPFTQDVWHYVAFTFDDPGVGQTKTLRLYIDGSQVATTTTTIAPGYDAHPAFIGADYDNEIIRYSWTGALDEISLFNRVLSTSEIVSIYNAGSRGKIKSAPTAAGANSQILISDATLAFANVTTDGTTFAYNLDAAAVGALPNGYTQTGLAYDISTTAAYPGAINLCFHLPALNDQTAFSKLKILHNENNALVDRTTGVNFPNRLVCGQVTSLSPFIIANSVSPTAANARLRGQVTTANGQPLAGVTMRLSGSHEAFAITDANGDFAFDNLAVEGFYITTPQLSGYSFVPASRSFTLSGNRTDAVFAAAPDNSLTANPLDDEGYFVRQQYLDFLNREPDAPGFNFWMNQITSCNGDAVCIDGKRTNVSAAYFLSREFQETGFFVIKLQRAAFGKVSQDAAKRISYSQFSNDSATVGKGFVDGQTGADQILDQNKTSYAQSVAGSQAFISRFPTSQSAAQFVDALFSTASVTPQGTERQDAITAFGAGDTAGRAAALRKVAESNSMKTAEFNSAFVLLQYFGYLRRNPTDAPDNSDAGYQFWLNKLNSFGGDYIKSELVRSFILSQEYRKRFGAS